MKKIVPIILVITFILIGATRILGWADDNLDQYRVYYTEPNYTEFEQGTTKVIDSLEEFTEFLQGNPPDSSKLASLLKKYNEEFFIDNVVYAHLLMMASGSTKVNASKVDFLNGQLKLTIKTKTPEIGTCDIANWVSLFPLDRNIAKNVKSIDVDVQK